MTTIDGGTDSQKSTRERVPYADAGRAMRAAMSRLSTVPTTKKTAHYWQITSWVISQIGSYSRLADQVKRRDVAEVFGVDPATVSRAMKWAAEKGVLTWAPGRPGGDWVAGLTPRQIERASVEGSNQDSRRPAPVVVVPPAHIAPASVDTPPRHIAQASVDPPRHIAQASVDPYREDSREEDPEKKIKRLAPCGERPRTAGTVTVTNNVDAPDLVDAGQPHAGQNVPATVQVHGTVQDPADQGDLMILVDAGSPQAGPDPMRDLALARRLLDRGASTEEMDAVLPAPLDPGGRRRLRESLTADLYQPDDLDYLAGVPDAAAALSTLDAVVSIDDRCGLRLTVDEVVSVVDAFRREPLRACEDVQLLAEDWRGTKVGPHRVDFAVGRLRKMHEQVARRKGLVAAC